MTAHGQLDILNCIGDLAFAVLSWSRRDKSAIAKPLTALFLVAFAWQLFDLQHELFGFALWPAHVLATLMPVLALEVVVVFVGKERVVRRAMYTARAATFGTVLCVMERYWWRLLLALAAGVMTGSIVLLVRHRKSTSDRRERARSDLILLAVAIGTLVGTTDLWYNELSPPVPRLSNVGTLVSLALFAVAALRLRLLGREVPIVFGVYALSTGVLWVAAYLASVYWLDRRTGLVALSVLTVFLASAFALREFRRSAQTSRERAQRLMGLGRLAEQLSHDLRNPLAALKGGLQFLTVEAQQARFLPAHGGYLQLLLEQVDRVEKVVRDYQRIGRVEPVCSRTSINEIVSGVLSMQRFATVPSVTLRAELGEGLPECSVDAELLSTALENVLCNAYESMQEGGGTVHVRTARAAGSDALELTVEDEGQGMDARELVRATDEFYTTKPSGTGLGLYFAVRVARVHGGALDLTSEVGKGTIVRLSIPVSS